MKVRLSALPAAASLPRNIILLLLVLISVGGSVNPRVQCGKVMKIIYLVGFRIRDLPATVPYCYGLTATTS
jgi:hypothetical protein